VLCPAIDNSASGEIRVVIRFLQNKSIIAAEMHGELLTVYSPNVTTEGTARECCRMFKDWRQNEQIFMMKGEVVGYL
jgi:hypothetical protein